MTSFLPEQLTCGFLGLGLIGGSIARALKEKGKNVTIIAYDTDAKALALAKEEGVADCVTETVSPVFGDCDILFLCAPVSCNIANMTTVKPYLSAHTILTDVGSTKTDMHRAIRNAGLSSQFIGGHPMAGSERIGYQNSKALLLENAYYILTPEPEAGEEKLRLLTELIRLLGALPLVLDAKKHDYITAAISHLPHVISASLVNLVQQEDGNEGLMKMIAAGGFKDITRISSSSPVMWQQICLTNTENISHLLGGYIRSLCNIKEALDHREKDTLYQFFDSARTYRDSFIDASSGPIKKSYSIRVDIPDETGSLATIATLLALNQISIKNIGIVHNREFEEGVLRIEFYEETAIHKAVKLLTDRGYTPHSIH